MYNFDLHLVSYKPDIRHEINFFLYFYRIIGKVFNYQANLVQHIFNKTLTALILTFAYTLLLVHNLVPHQHGTDAAPPAHHATAHHHHHHDHHQDQDQEHAESGHEDPDKPVSASGHFLSNHQHSFADNKIHHLDTQAAIKLAKKQVFPVLVCCLSFNNYLFHLPDTVPDPPAYQLPATHFSSRSHALRGPPVA
jgi:hypothetical protein